MKKAILTLVCFSILTAAMAQSTKLTVKFQGVQDGDKIGLILIDGENYSKPTFETPLTNGEAVLEFEVPDVRGFYTTVNGKHLGETITLDKGENAIFMGKVSKQGDYYRVAHVSITGSPTYDFYQQKRVNRSALNKRYEEYHKNPAYEKLQTLSREDTVARKAIMATDDYKKFEADEKAFFNNVGEAFKTALANGRDSWVGPFTMLTEYSYLTEQQLPEWEQFTDDVKQSYYGKIVHDKIVPPSMEGKQMPDFAFTDYATKQQSSLKHALAGKKYLLLDFWASWCRPCRAEIPNLKAQYEQYYDKGFQILSISADKRESDWLKALDEEKLPWLNDRDTDDKGIANLYKVQYYPTIYLLDADGKVVAKDIRGEILAAKLKELFAY